MIYLNESGTNVIYIPKHYASNTAEFTIKLINLLDKNEFIISASNISTVGNTYKFDLTDNVPTGMAVGDYMYELIPDLLGAEKIEFGIIRYGDFDTTKTEYNTSTTKKQYKR